MTLQRMDNVGLVVESLDAAISFWCAGDRDYAPGYYAAYLLDPDGNNVEALYRDVGNIGHGESAALH